MTSLKENHDSHVTDASREDVKMILHFILGYTEKKNSKPDRARQFCFRCEPIFSLKIRLCAAFFPCWKCLNLTVAWTNLNGPTTRLLHF